MSSSYPEGTIPYDADGVILAGELTPEQVTACLAAGVKSWLYLNAESHANCPKAAVEAAAVGLATCFSPRHLLCVKTRFS
jgi:hypothetical protein